MPLFGPCPYILVKNRSVFQRCTRPPKNVIDNPKNVIAGSPPQKCLCEAPAGDEAISWHCVTNGQIAAPFGLAMTFLYASNGQIAAPFGLAMTFLYATNGQIATAAAAASQ